MSNDVVLSAALRSNLLALQNTQKGIDTHQGHLSTGKKVSSALDNPQSFFAAQSLSNRASDLSGLLDSIGQSIQVITAANNGVTALTSLVNQAQSIASQAQSTLDSASQTAKTTGSVALDGTAKLSTLTGFGASGDILTFEVTNPDGSSTSEPIGASSGTNTVTTASGDTVNDLITKINDLNTNQTNALSTPAIKASLDSSGHLQLEAVNGGTLHVKFTSGTTNDATHNTAIATSLGYSGIAKVNTTGAASSASTVDFTATSKANLTSQGLYTSAGTLAQASTLLTSLKASDGTTGLATLAASATTYTLKVGGKTSGNLLTSAPSAQTVQGLVDAINHDSNINSLVQASFDATTGKIALKATDAAATDVQFAITGASGQQLNLGFGVENVASSAASSTGQETVRFGAASSSLATLETQFNSVRSQIDSLVTDTGYAGTNLLNGDNLTTYFDEGHTSSLNTQGVSFTSGGLGIKTANFANDASVGSSLDQVSAALSTVRSFGNSIAGDLSIIQTRQTFTNNLINTLTTGSDNLTNADQNEESADLLSLQTRQSLGVTALSLASQSQQAVLKLF